MVHPVAVFLQDDALVFMDRRARPNWFRYRAKVQGQNPVDEFIPPMLILRIVVGASGRTIAHRPNAHANSFTRMMSGKRECSAMPGGSRHYPFAVEVSSRQGSGAIRNAQAAGGGLPTMLRAIIFSLALNIRICLTFKSVAPAALRTAQTSTRSKA